MLLSCTTSPKKASNEIKIPAFPDPITEDGRERLYYDDVLNKYLLDPDYMDELIKYGFDVEAAAQALSK